MFGAALVTLASSPTADAAFPGANGQLVLADNDEISTINPDGSCPRQITGGVDGGQIAFARVSGDHAGWKPLDVISRSPVPSAFTT